MKTSFTLLLVIAISISVFAQEVLYEDPFDENLYQWEIPGGLTEPVFKEGNMILRGNTEEAITIALNDIALDPNKDFTVIASCSYNGGYSGDSFGMLLSDESHSDNPTHYFLMVFPGEGFEIPFSTSTGPDLRFLAYYPLQKNKNLARSENEDIEFKLTGTAGLWEYFINGQKVWSKADPGICITSVGFFTMGLREFRIDHMAVKQDGWKEINLADDSKIRYEKENLGRNVNSEASELLPIISPDGQTLYLCVMGDPENAGDKYDQDIWYSTLNPDNTWSKRVNAGFPLNNASSNFVSYVSPDNNTLLLGNRYDSTGNLAGDGLSITHRTNEGWSIPEPVEIENYYNNNNYISVTYSPSGKTLILSIEREDTYGCKDLYVSHRGTEGTWSEPLNMGPDINTFGDEISPFLSADNTTLYFATYARPGYGGYDIFLTRRLDETWVSWTRPVNLGSSINSSGGDAYFTIPASGEYSYLVSARNTFGSADIFRVKVAESAKPKPVALISGTVYDQKTLHVLEALITYFNLETNEEIGTARSNPDDGRYKIALPGGFKYSYLAQKEGYISVSENIDLTELDEYREFTRDLYLVPIEVGQVIRLNNIFFEFDKSDLLEASVYELDRLAVILKDNPTMTIRIEGHTDYMGSDAYNQKLSEDRARSVYTYLQGKSLGSRASSAGYGESKPVATNETDEGRALNRRVEFVILSK